VAADSIVADSPDEMFTETMASAPSSSSRRKAASKAPGEGAAVSGRTRLAASSS
jgi:hypothetical protein